MPPGPFIYFPDFQILTKNGICTLILSARLYNCKLVSSDWTDTEATTQQCSGVENLKKYRFLCHSNPKL